MIFMTRLQICWICGGKFTKDDDKDNYKVRDHCHYTGWFSGAAHNLCNIRYMKPNFTPIFFHNLSGYDAHLFVKNLGSSKGYINCIPNNEEQYISFTKRLCICSSIDRKGEEKFKFHKMRFLDSFKFLPSSLSRLVKNLKKDDFKIIC